MQFDINAVIQALWRNGYITSKSAAPTEVKSFIQKFRENYVSVELIRMGSSNDGGYLVPTILEEIDICFSPGVDYKASFEKDLSDSFNIKSFMADASVNAPPFENKNFIFLKKYLGSKNTENTIKLSSWIGECAPLSDSLLLQMDIEGGEIDVLITETANTLSRFKCMVIEFHFLDKLFEPLFLRTMSTIFDKIFENFSVVHVHPNNSGSIVSVDDVEVPSLIECTFLRNDLVARYANEDPIQLPHKLDSLCGVEFEDITMPKKWWSKD